jgi:hypothetical protein
VRVAANLPYNIGSALLVKWLTSETWPPFWQSLTLMFQREVAERIVARPDTDGYGRLSVLSQWRARARILFDISPRAFVPPPKVTSAVIRIEPLAEPVAAAALSDLEAVTQSAFGQRRKMLRQSLKTLVPDAGSLVREAALDPTARAETLTVEDFARWPVPGAHVRVKLGRNQMCPGPVLHLWVEAARRPYPAATRYASSRSSVSLHPRLWSSRASSSANCSCSRVRMVSAPSGFSVRVTSDWRSGVVFHAQVKTSFLFGSTSR